MSDNATLPATDAELSKLRGRAVVACLVGHLFELYDFGVYGYFAAAIGHAIFPSTDPVVSILSSFATYGVGFFMRPVGALVIGSYGDRYGRRAALIFTVTMMAIATGLTGLVPSYDTAGIFAPIMLVLCRLAQGFSTGGEWGGAASFMVEYAPANRRGFFGSLQQVSTGLGQLLSITMAFTLSSLLDAAQLGDWGWRVAFLFGLLLAPVGHYLRSRVAETPVFRRDATTQTVMHSPVREAFGSYGGRMFLAFGITIIWTVGSYVFFTFMPTYASQQLGISSRAALGSTALAAVLNICCLPLVGALSDRIGRKIPLMLSAVGYLLLSYPLFAMVVSERSFTALLTAQIIGSLLYALINGVGSAMMCELFPTRVRYTALSVGYNGAVMVFGGFAPFIATYLTRATGQLVAPSYYVVACAAVSILFILKLKDRSGEAL
ncbi:MFS transporter [Acidisphaera sp. L21]|uniref:MFS transporter n=1 Tax=Acidisphaera sp. L21 TaxID=1641851 RepID=UPI00131E2383|nr:MFS transporter [Acidisphaera sp. L21]